MKLQKKTNKKKERLVGDFTVTLKVRMDTLHELQKYGLHKEPFTGSTEQEFFKPMLAKNYDDFKGDLFAGDGVVYAQPKLDGVRCIATLA